MVSKHERELLNVKPSSVPIPPSWSEKESDCLTKSEAKKYRALVGSIQYLGNGSRPDIAFACSILGQFLKEPREHHLDMALSVLYYLNRTQDMVLFYPIDRSSQIIAYSDSDYAGCTRTSRSRSGHIFMIGKNSVISWKSQLQHVVALSTCEAEFYALTTAVKEAIHIRRLHFELDHLIAFPDEQEEYLNPVSMNLKPKDKACENQIQRLILHVDNKSAIQVARSPGHKVTKHVRVRLQFVHFHVEQGSVDLHWVGTKGQVADIFTKPLVKAIFNFQRDKCGLRRLKEE